MEQGQTPTVVGKRVILVKKNKFKFEGVVIQLTPTMIFIDDIKDGFMGISLADVEWVEEKKDG